jgi:amidase
MKMAFVRPSLKQVSELAESISLGLSDREIAQFLSEMAPSFEAYSILDTLDDVVGETKYARSAGYRPTGEENAHGAWARKSEVTGAPTGPLAGKTIVLKDNISLAGVPMINGSPTLEGFVPNVDATVVTRILDAGGKILGKATCESFCMSGGSHTSYPGPVHNPWRPGSSAGGSSSGSAVLVATAEAEMAIGCDQGGSIRIPSSYCGIYGMKPSWGLVPYTGIMPIEATLDHAGPMTATVADNALLLDVIAGNDGLDPRQYGGVKGDYIGALKQEVAGLRIALVRESFSCAGMQPDVAAKVRTAARRLAELGAIVTEISIPEHVTATAVWTPIAVEGLTTQMMFGNGMGFNWKGRYDTALLDAHADWRQQTDKLSASLKLSILTGLWGLRRHNGHYYAKAQNLSRIIAAAYDKAFASFDLLLMPTLPRTASPLPEADASLAEIIARAAELNVNTCPFDVSGHPAMSVPCELSDGLPVGMMLVGGRFQEATIYRAAAGFEASGGWQHF